jgi:uncharacterized protein YeaO (DUF488 family)
VAAINIKRIYKPVEKTDGFRILVDRLWPRGVSRETAHLDAWLKEIAPSTELRKTFHNSDAPDKWNEFKADYITELKQNEAVKQLIGFINNNGTVTLLYSVPDENQNHALVLKQFIDGMNKH